jgi:hypothetical protein
MAKRFADKMHPLRYQRPQALQAPATLRKPRSSSPSWGLAPVFERHIAHRRNSAHLVAERRGAAPAGTAALSVTRARRPEG